MATDWKAKIAAAQAAAEAAKGAITEDDRAEIEARAEIAKADAERKAAEREKREIDLARRFDDAEAVYAPQGVRLAKVSIEDGEDTFIVRCDAKAHARWESQIAECATNKKLDRVEVARSYAAAVVVDWNGIVDWAPGNLNGHKLIEHLKKNPGIATPLVGAAAKLAGLFAEERKS